MQPQRNPGARDDVPHGLEPIDEPHDDIANGDDVGYSTYRHTRRADTDWFEVSWATGSDYSGGSVTKANYNALQEMLAAEFPEGEKPAVWLRASGGHRTYSLLVKWPALSDDIVDVLNGLDDYPVISDEAVNEEENERENEAWESWARHDFEKAFLSAWNAHWNEDEELDDWPEEVTGDMTYSMFHVGMELANEYWVHESGDSVFIRMEKIADKLVDLLAGGTVPSWLSPDQFSEMLEVAKAFGMESVEGHTYRASQPVTHAELEARGQQRLPHVKNARPKQWQVWRETAGEIDKVLAQGGEGAMKLYYKRHGGEQAGLHVGYDIGFVGTLQQFAKQVGIAETNADVEDLKQLSRDAPPAGVLGTERKYWVLLQILAGHKAKAIGYRLAGHVSSAVREEKEADSIYKQLPANLKW